MEIFQQKFTDYLYIVANDKIGVAVVFLQIFVFLSTNVVKCLEGRCDLQFFRMLGMLSLCTSVSGM